MQRSCGRVAGKVGPDGDPAPLADPPSAPARPGPLFIPGIVDLLVVEESTGLDCLYLIPMEGHIGAEEFDEGGFKRWTTWIRATPHARVLLVGDLFEFALKDSVGDVFSQKLSPEEQMEWAVEALSPITGQVYGICDGNHEWRVTKDSSIRPGKWVSKCLGVPYFSDGQGVIKVRFGKGENGKPVCYTVYFAHGSSNARTPGGKLNAGWGMAGVLTNADVYISGHSHGHTADRGERLVVDPYNNLVRSEKFGVALAGSFLNYAGYAKQRVMRPLGTGCPRIRLDGRRKDVHISV